MEFIEPRLCCFAGHQEVEEIRPGHRALDLGLVPHTQAALSALEGRPRTVATLSTHQHLLGSSMPGPPESHCTRGRT